MGDQVTTYKNLLNSFLDWLP